MKRARQKPKRGPISRQPGGGCISQEVIGRSAPGRLEIRTIQGDMLYSHDLAERVMSHRLMADGRSVLLFVDAILEPHGFGYDLRILDLETGQTRPLGFATSLHLALDAGRIAWFCGDRLIVQSLSGDTVLEHHVGELNEHHAVALLPEGQVALSLCKRMDACIADLRIIDQADGRLVAEYSFPVETSYDAFAVSGLRPDPQGRYVAMPGYYSGLILADLRTGRDVADRFEPLQLELADNRRTTHAHHLYGDIAFDAAGEYIAAACHPGAVCVWNREGQPVVRQDVFVNPKADRVVVINDGKVTYCDSFGDSATIELPTQPCKFTSRAGAVSVNDDVVQEPDAYGEQEDAE